MPLSRHLLFPLASCTLLLAMVTPGEARPLAQNPGFGADLAITTAVIQQTSQFNVDSDNEITENLSNAGKNVTDATFFPLARLDFTLQNLRTQFFVGNSRDNVGKGQFQIELGATHQYPDQTEITFAYFPKLPFLGETWKDPYLTNQVRETTDENAQGGRLALNRIAGSQVSAEYAFAFSRIDDERSGVSLPGLSQTEQDSLHRDAHYQRLTIDYTLPISAEITLKPGVFYTQSDAKGASNSFDEYALRLQTIYRHRQHLFTGTAQYASTLMDVTNPVFDRRQHDNRYSLFALYNYFQPFGWKNWSIIGLGFIGKTDSTIAFYEQESAGISLGVGYRWR
ncbi:MAG: DUF2860 domain-containing protein [Hahellaceae bacterium]|nr:DUF2860 domain-containing protein [Hahellaceae bacterium]MCP5212621.1 DUF2860 domain-containing protein [Hahellaceae bacterium]